MQTMSEYIPQKTISCKAVNPPWPCWLAAELHKLIRKKHQMFKKWKSTKQLDIYSITLGEKEKKTTTTTTTTTTFCRCRPYSFKEVKILQNQMSLKDHLESEFSLDELSCMRRQPKMWTCSRLCE